MKQEELKEIILDNFIGNHELKELKIIVITNNKELEELSQDIIRDANNFSISEKFNNNTLSYGYKIKEYNTVDNGKITFLDIDEYRKRKLEKDDTKNKI